MQIPDLLCRIGEGNVDAVHVADEDTRREHRHIVGSADDHVRVVAALRVDQTEAVGVEELTGVKDDHAGTSPCEQQVRPDIGRHCERSLVVLLRRVHGNVVRGIEGVKVALGPFRASVLGQEAIEQRLAIGQPSPLRAASDEIEVEELVQDLRCARL